MTKHSWFRSEKFFYITFFLQDLLNTWHNFVARTCNAGISSTLLLYLLCNLRNSTLPLPCNSLPNQILADILKILKKTKHQPNQHTFQKYVSWAKLYIYIFWRLLRYSLTDRTDSLSYQRAFLHFNLKCWDTEIQTYELYKSFCNKQNKLLIWAPFYEGVFCKIKCNSKTGMGSDYSQSPEQLLIHSEVLTHRMPDYTIQG